MDRQLLIALNAASNITRAALCRLAQSDSWHGADATAAEDLAGRLGVPAKQMKRALAVRDRAALLAERELSRAERAGCHILTVADDDYPPSLYDLSLPPPVLYCRGEVPAGPAIAMVGSRKMDAYGREVAECFAARLAGAGVVVVSGFARGIDCAAHRAAVAAPGKTVAVLGCGVDVDYPRGQGPLARRIAESGAVVSEFPFGAEPRPWHFPIRNRVIAALARATLVVQATLKSGSLITAHHALELGRDVYAVPGRIFDESALGANALLADGALVARTPEDLLERHGLPGVGQQQLFAAPVEDAPPAEPQAVETVQAARPDGTAGKVLDAMPPGRAQTAEDIANRLPAPVDRVLGALLELELGGWIRREPGPVYVR